MNLEFDLARRYLASRKGAGLSVITWIALVGVTVGVMSLITVMAVMSGFDRDLREKILGNNAHIFISLKHSETKDAVDRTVREVESRPNIASAMPTIYGEAFLLSPAGTSEGISLRGVDPDKVGKVLELKHYAVKGDFSGLREGGIVLGDSLALRLGLNVGDSVTALFNRGEFSPLGIVPKMRKFKVVDVFHSGMTQFDSYHGYISLEVAEDLFELNPKSIEVRTNDVRRLFETTEDLRNQIPDAFLVQDWISQNKEFLSALKLEKTAMAVILALIILVAAMNICGSLIMIVKEKTKDIAILKSMGASDQSILRIFFLQGMFIGSLGTFVGVGLGALLSIVLRDYIRFPLDKEVYMIDMLPVDIRVSDVSVVILGALLISAIATLYPARLASRIHITEGLKAD